MSDENTQGSAPAAPPAEAPQGQAPSRGPRGRGGERGGRGGPGGGRGGRRDRNREETASEFIENVVAINRVAKVVKGGRRFSFSALTVVGDRAGQVGYGFGKANDVSDAIRKSIEKAKRSMVRVSIKKSTLPHQVIGKFKSAQVLLRPAAPGTGVIAGGPVRAVMEAAGVHDVLSKSLGSSNAINTVKAVFQGLESLMDPRTIAGNRGKTLKDMWG